MIRHGVVRWTREDLPGHDQHVLMVSFWVFGFSLKWRGRHRPAAYDATFPEGFQRALDERINVVMGDERYPLSEPLDEEQDEVRAA